MIDRKPLKRSNNSDRKAQTAAIGSLSGQPRPSEALPHAANRRMIGVRKPANGECPLICHLVHRSRQKIHPSTALHADVPRSRLCQAPAG